MRGEKEDLDENETDNYDHKGGSNCSLSIKYEIHSQFLPSQKVFKEVYASQKVSKKVSALSEIFRKVYALSESFQKVSALSERLLSFPSPTFRDCDK